MKCHDDNAEDRVTINGQRSNLLEAEVKYQAIKHLGEAEVKAILGKDNAKKMHQDAADCLRPVFSQPYDDKVRHDLAAQKEICEAEVDFMYQRYQEAETYLTNNP